MSSDEVLIERINNLSEKIDSNDAKADEWRQRFCKKLDAIQAEIPVHKEKLKGLDRLWSIVYFCIPVLFTLAVAWGSLGSTVEKHGKSIYELESIHPRYSFTEVIQNAKSVQS